MASVLDLAPRSREGVIAPPNNPLQLPPRAAFQSIVVKSGGELRWPIAGGQRPLAQLSGVSVNRMLKNSQNRA